MTNTASLNLTDANMQPCASNYIKATALSCLELDIPVNFPVEEINNETMVLMKEQKNTLIQFNNRWKQLYKTMIKLKANMEI